MKVAIVGSGIAGLAVAHALQGHANLTLFEADSHFGGHAHTVDVTLPTATGMATHGVDTGFLVFNERTYPQLIRLFDELGVETAKSDMSFSVQVANAFGNRALEWSGSSLSTVFAQRRNLFNAPFLSMLRDLLRFNTLTTQIALQGSEAALQEPLGAFLQRHRFGDAFRDWYFLPMMGCIWSCPTAQMLQFPVSTMVRFCHNHGLIQVRDRPQWWTVRGGSRNYVQKIIAGVKDARLQTPVRWIKRQSGGPDAGVWIGTDNGQQHFDKAVIATHSDQALRLLRDPSGAERAILGAIRYHPNRAVLHTDSSVLPSRRSAWSAWNYESAMPGQGAGASATGQVCLHYLLNMLQPLPWTDAVVVSLNPQREIPRTKVLGEYAYAHPVFDRDATRAQARVADIQGPLDTWYCGAWMGYGFHEDGLKAGLSVASQVLAQRDVPQPQAWAA